MYAIMHIAPFGGISNAWEDADIQYLDFFSYYRDVLTGKNSIRYSMTNSLGNNNIGLFSYYLASPWNLLILCFPQSQFQTFFSLLVALKLAFASFTACYYLQSRFTDKIQPLLACLLACGYGMMQYNLAQASNIMWLDGVSMLPLMLLGVYKLVNQKKIHPLAIATACAILFNWYTAGINCIWCCFVLLIEYALVMCERKFAWSEAVWTVIRYGIAMLLGICMSAVLFFPTILNLRKGKGGSLNFSFFTDVISGNPFSVIRDYTIGGTSNEWYVSLFAGSLILLGCLSFFFHRGYTRKQKVVIGCGILFSWMIYFLRPLELIFSLFKEATSYQYRYSYVSISFLMFVAGLAFAKKEKVSYLRLAIGYTIVYVAISIVFPRYPAGQMGITLGILFLIAVFLRQTAQSGGRKQKIWFALLMLISMSELTLNAASLVRVYSLDSVSTYVPYVTALDTQLDALRDMDEGTYRISQTSRRGHVAHLNESMGYNYWGNTGYTSCPDNRQLVFLHRLGYKADGDCMNIVANSILTADSLLGVKYVIANQQYPGLLPVEHLPQANGKAVYENPYCLPFACIYTEGEETEYTNPFEYQNELYSRLYGETLELYTPIAVQSVTEGNTRTYTLQVPEGEYALYGNIITAENVKGRVGRVGTKGSSYSDWLSMSVFPIEKEMDETEVLVFFTAEKGLAIVEEQFYALNLEALENACAKISLNQPETLQIKNGTVVCTVQGKEGEALYLSIPYEEGWEITRNGEAISAQSFAECMCSIPLTDGENRIEMQYHIPGMKQGILVSLLGIVCLIFCCARQKKTGIENVYLTE